MPNRDGTGRLGRGKNCDATGQDVVGVVEEWVEVEDLADEALSMIMIMFRIGIK